jgi:hypothetical protein
MVGYALILRVAERSTQRRDWRHLICLSFCLILMSKGCVCVCMCGLGHGAQLLPLGRYLQVQPTNVAKNTNPLRHKFRPLQHTNTTSKGFDIAKYSKDRRQLPNFCILTSYMKSSVKPHAKLELNLE